MSEEVKRKKLVWYRVRPCGADDWEDPTLTQERVGNNKEMTKDDE